MKVIIIEDDTRVNSSKAKESEILFQRLKKKGIDVHIVQSNPQFLGKPLSNKQKKKYLLSK